jgi:hypothetical protein
MSTSVDTGLNPFNLVLDLFITVNTTIGYNGFITTCFDSHVIVRLRSEPFGFSSIITYSFLFWRLLVGVQWWLALH